MKNGRGPQWDDPKITSISAARKKAEQAKRAVGTGAPRRSFGELLLGAVIVAMAVGMLIWWTRPLWQSAATLGR